MIFMYEVKVKLLLFFINLIDITKRLIPFGFVRAKSLAVKKYLILRFLKSNLDIKSFESQQKRVDSTDVFKKYIWVCWFQGVDKAPTLVKRCIDSIRINAPSEYEVVVLDEVNIPDYVTFPAVILEKYASGIISKAQLSDILRFNLLATYGGVWVDATVFCTKKLSFTTNTEFYSLKSQTFDNANSISKGLWTGYFLKCSPEYAPFIFIKDCFNKYWEKNDILIDYFLVDYLMLLAFEFFEVLRTDINNLDYHGNNRFLLEQLLPKAVTPENNDLLANDKIGIYKLTIKRKFPVLSSDKILTYFGKYFGEGDMKI